MANRLAHARRARRPDLRVGSVQRGAKVFQSSQALMKSRLFIIAASALACSLSSARAEFSNPQNFDNGQQFLELYNGLGQLQFLTCIAIGCLLFVAFSTRFRP
jgi:nitric oxide reductase large subunit